MAGSTVSRNCPACGVVYQADPVRLRHGRQTTCSRACSYKLRGAARTKTQTLTCAVCGTTIERPPSHVKGKHGANFCSPECHYKGRADGTTKRVVLEPYNVSDAGREALRDSIRATNARRKADGNYGHSEATRKRLAHTSSAALAEGRVSRVSKLEGRAAEALAALGYSFQPQFGIRNPSGRYVAVADFLVGDDIILEVNGTYWHSDPRVYPGELNATQQHNQQRFEAKCDLLRELGYRIAIVWELDLKANAQAAVVAALEAAT